MRSIWFKQRHSSKTFSQIPELRERPQAGWPEMDPLHPILASLSPKPSTLHSALRRLAKSVRVQASSPDEWLNTARHSPTTPERPAMKKTSSKPTRTRLQKKNESPSHQLKRLSRKLASEEFRLEPAAGEGPAAEAAPYRRIIE
jgi:hypothetical protein